MAPILRISFLGIGNMGAALAQAFLKAGHEVTIWNRTAERQQVKDTAAAGAVFEADITAAVQENTVIVLCLLDYVSIYQATASLPRGSLEGKTIINLTNGTPKDAQKMAGWAKERHFATRYFDGAIMVTPAMVGGEHSFLVISGETEDAFSKEAAPLLAAAGRPQYEGEEIGAAARFDVAALSMMFCMFGGGFLGMALLKRGATDVKLGPAIQGKFAPFLAPFVPYLGLLAESWDKEAWKDTAGSSIGMCLEGAKNIIRACEEESVDPGPIEFLTGLLQKGADAYGGAGNLAAAGPFLLNIEALHR